jgi:8-oxo-dGTP diphosphatase
VVPKTFTAAGLLVNEKGEVLFGRRADWKSAWANHWDAIGGRVEVGETAEDAMVREIREEIAVDVQSAHLLAVVENVTEDGQTTQSQIFVVTEWEGTPVNACDEHSEIRWFTLQQLADLANLAGRGYSELAERAVVIRTAAFRGMSRGP